MSDFSGYEKLITFLLTFISFLLTLGLWLMGKIRTDWKETNDKLINTNLTQTRILSDLEHTIETVDRHEKMHDEHYRNYNELRTAHAGLDCVRGKYTNGHDK